MGRGGEGGREGGGGRGRGDRERGQGAGCVRRLFDYFLPTLASGDW